MLVGLTLEGWKSFEKSSVALGPLTLLVGANGSGKSNLLDALRVLQGLAQGLTISECLNGRREGGGVLRREIRGGFAEATFRGSGHFALTSSFRLPPNERVDYRMHCRSGRGGIPALANEVLFANGTQFFEGRLSPSDALSVGMNTPLSPLVGVERTRRAPSILTLFDRDSVGSPVPQSAQNHLSSLAGSVRRSLSSATFYELNPEQMRGYVAKSTRGLGAQGEHLSGALFSVCQDAERKRDLVDWVSELCAPTVLDIDFVDVEETDDVLAVLVEETGTRITARSMSDGTLRFLGLLTAVLTAEPGSLLLFEEIESGLHPTRLHLLMQLLERTTKARQIQVIATSHSPTALRELSREALGDVVVFGRHADASGTVMKRLRDLPQFEEVASKRGVEHLFTTGWLERAL